MITGNYLRNIYLDFFKSKGHVIIPSASLIPENDPTVLFTTAGMQPLVPYLLGEKHPTGKRLANVQKCIRTNDIESVGDSTHCTFLEMLGNWSLGDYFKKESIAWSFEFLTSPSYLNINIDRLYFTVFEGDENAPKDMETFKEWKSLGVEESHLFFLPKEDNWWGPVGVSGPCGPDTEVFYDTHKPKCSASCKPGCSCEKYVEIWNNVFMEYNKTEDGRFEPLLQKNVDTGMGLERINFVLSEVDSVYNTDSFRNLILELENLSDLKYDSEYMKNFRIIADHIRSTVFILGDEKAVVPTNTDQGYILRRLIRRSIRHLRILGIEDNVLADLSGIVINDYSKWYKELEVNKKIIKDELEKEEKVFSQTIENGIKEFYTTLRRTEGKQILGKDAFRLYDTFGFPLEFTEELAQENGFNVDVQGYEEAYREHQNKSRKGAQNKFKGGLADDSENTIRLHTATHILHATLRKMFGTSVEQRGSNINTERLRFDFLFERKLNKEEIQAIEDEINRIIDENVPVILEEMTVEEAMNKGVIGLFTDTYSSEKVKTYRIGDYSFEICGGPHVKTTKELGKLVIDKEQSSSAGIRRIRAHLE